MAISFVQSISFNSNTDSGAFGSFAYTNNYVAGNCLVVVIVFNNDSTATADSFTVQTSLGTNFTKVRTDLNNNPSGNKLATTIWVLPNAPSSADMKHITTSYGGTQAAHVLSQVYMLEFGGVATSSPVDTSAGPASSSSTTAWNDSSVTPTNSDVLIAVVGGPNGSNSLTVSGPGGSWTDLGGGNGSNPSLAGENLMTSAGYILNTSTAQGYNATASGAAFYCGSIVALKPAALSVTLTVAQVNINAPAPQPPVILPRAQINISALAPTLEYALSLTTAGETINAPAIQPRIILTLLAALAARSGTDDSGAGFAAGFTGQVTAFQRSSSPLVAEVWHNLTPPSGWSGTCRYKALSEVNMIVVDFELSNAGASGNVVVMTLPAAYRFSGSTRDYPLAIQSNTAPPNSNQRFFVKNDGTVNTFGLPTSTTVISATQIVALD